MVKEITKYMCDCHGHAHNTMADALKCEKETSKCYYCKEPVEDVDWSKGNMVVCPKCKPEHERQSMERLGHLFG